MAGNTMTQTLKSPYPAHNVWRRNEPVATDTIFSEVPAIGTNYLFSQKSKTLFFIDASYWLLFYIAMGLVHAYMP